MGMENYAYFKPPDLNKVSGPDIAIYSEIPPPEREREQLTRWVHIEADEMRSDIAVLTRRCLCAACDWVIPASGGITFSRTASAPSSWLCDLR